MAARPRRRRRGRRPHRRVPRRPGAARLAADLGAVRARPCGRRRRRRRAQRRPRCSSSTGGSRGPSGAELTELRAQALRLALARAQQGDEPQQLHRADGRHATARSHTPRGRALVRRRPATPTSIVPEPRLRAHARRRQRAAARVLPAARAPARAGRERARRRRRRRRTAPSPAPATRIERIAGATTDLQHIVHQGHDPLRRDVLGRRQRGAAQGGAGRHRRGRRTTAASRSAATSRTAPSSRTPSRASTSASTAGSSYNYPERLSYSATPPDFGSLCIQRQRWANGGLLILPKLLGSSVAQAAGVAAAVARRAVPAHELHGVDLLGELSAALLLLLYPFNEDAAQPARAGHRAPVLRRDGDRPEAMRLQAARRVRASTGSTSSCCP